MKRKQKISTDALTIVQQRYYEGRPSRQAALDSARADDQVARKIYELRKESGLTQRQLAKLVGTTASVICRLEDADYEGHSLVMLRRIAAVLHAKVEIQFVPIKSKTRKAA